MERAEIQRQVGAARSLFAAGDHAGAARIVDSVIAAAPQEPNALHLRALLRRAAGDAHGALSAIDAALAAAPGAAPMHVLRGDILLTMGEPGSALEAFNQAAATGLAHPAIWSGRGVALMKLGMPEGAVSCFRQCVEHNPNDADAHYNGARALQALDRLSDALKAYDAALALKPDDPAIHHNRAILLQWLNRRADALAAFDRALSLHPGREETLYSKGVALMAFGDYALGWPLLELRHKPSVVAKARNHARGEPAWRGERLNGALRIWPEQGIGDEILLARLASFAQTRTGDIILECAQRLKPLFARAMPGMDVRSLEEGESAPRAAAQIAMGSLGAALSITADQIRGAPYLQADVRRRTALRTRYEEQARGRKIIGIAWRSGNAELGPHKSTSLAAWGALLGTDALFVDLQYGDTEADRIVAQSDFGCEILHDDRVNQLVDLDAFAAQVSSMDAIMSVSNTTVHMAGALGVPCIVLAPPAQGLLWYWGAGTASTPWYDSVTIERRAEGGPWSAQIARATARLGL